MTEPLKNRAVLIQRAIVLDGLRALYLTQHKFNRSSKEDDYSTGYKEGFQDALFCVAQLIGASAEFETIRKQFDRLELGACQFVIPFERPEKLNKS